MAMHNAEVRARAMALAEEYGPAEAARRTGVPSGTIKAWLHRAGKQVGRRPRATTTATQQSRPKAQPQPNYKPQRDAKGRYLPGHSGNPTGSTSAAQIARREAEKFTPRAIEILKSIAEDERQRIYARLEALKELLDRGLGRAPQAVTIDARTEHRYVYELTQRIVADPDAARLADELLGRVAGDPGRVRVDRVREALAAGEAPETVESLPG